MAEDITKRVAVTFATGLPLGTHAHFKHDGEIWIAYPAKKNQRILAVIDRMVGVFSTFTRQMVDWMNKTPADAPQVAMLLESLARAQRLREELIAEKVESRTQ